MRLWLKWALVLMACALLALAMLTGCRLPASSAAGETQVNPQTVFTAAALTADARRIENTPLPPTETHSAATATQASLLPTATLPLTVTRIALTGTVLPYTDEPAAGDDRSEFVSDVTVPDGMLFEPGEAFVKTWRLQNIGGAAWTTDYKVVFLNGDLMDGPLNQNLPSAVIPGEVIDLSVDFVAPPEPGDYRGYWKLQNPDGEFFGVGIDSKEAFWVDIRVAPQQASGDATPTSPGDSALASVTLGVDQDIYSGVCPHTYRFTAQFLLNKPATIAYNLEADNDVPMQVKLPPPAMRNLEAGLHTIIFELTFFQSQTGRVRLQVTAPDALTSNRVNYELECQ